MAGIPIGKAFDKVKLAGLADGLVVAVAVSLPWSTSATAILVVVWLFVLIPTLRWADIRRELAMPAGGLPVVLVVLGLAGMLWADLTLFERWRGADSFFKLLVIPLLFMQFRRSDRGPWVFGGYLASCAVLLIVSTVIQFFHPFSLALHPPPNVVLVKNAPTQSGEFVTCIFGMLYLASEAVERRRWLLLLGFVATILAMLGSILFVATGRTALVVALVLLVLFATRKLSTNGIVLVFSAAILVGIIGWHSSPNLRERTKEIWTDLQRYEARDTITSSGERLVFWKKSIEFIRQSPLIGHGTGSIHSSFEKSAIGQTGAAGEAVANPHNQTLAIAIQLGFAGAAVLWAMWIAHLLLFRGNGLVEWIGFVVVVQNIIGSLFNSHLFDFVQGWVYVIGVGVAGGVALRSRVTPSNRSESPTNPKTEFFEYR
ncbi:MAG TPA: O-antigen ligase family protein [Pseudolabrys sp.]